MIEFENRYAVLYKDSSKGKFHLYLENIEDCYYAWRVFERNTTCYCINGVVILYGKSSDGSTHIQTLDSNDKDGNACVIERGDAVIIKNINYLEVGEESYPIPSTIGLESEYEIISTEKKVDFEEVYNGICKYLRDV